MENPQEIHSKTSTSTSKSKRQPSETNPSFSSLKKLKIKDLSKNVDSSNTLSLSWSSLSSEVQFQLLEDVKASCGIELNPSSDILQSGAISRLLNLQNGNSESFSYKILGEMVQDYLSEKLSKINEKAEDFLEDLGRISAKHLFPKQFEVFRKWKGFKNKPYLTLLVSVGLLKKNNSSENEIQFVFVNEYVCPYYLGKFILKYGVEFPSFCKVIFELEEVKVTIGGHSIQSYEFKNKLSIYFIDFFLETEDGQEVLRAILQKINEDNNQNLIRFALACIMDNRVKLLNLLFTSLSLTVTLDMVFIAVEFGNSKVSDMILERYADFEPIASLKFHKFSLLHMAVERGNADLVRRLLEKYGYDKQLQDKREDLRNVIHICVEYTCDMTQKEIEERKEIVSEIHKVDATLINEKDAKWKNTPVLCDKVHLDLIKHLVNLGADIYACDDDERTLAHVAVAGLSPQQYHDVIEYLNSNGYNDLLRTRDFCDATPLHYAVIFVDLKEETLKIFEEAGVGVNDLDEYQRTVLHIAAGKGRSPEFIKMLVQTQGADVNARDRDSHTVLHCVIVEAPEGNKEIVQALIDMGADVNRRDNAGHTPHWWASKGLKKEKLEDSIKLLRDNGAIE